MLLTVGRVIVATAWPTTPRIDGYRCGRTNPEWSPILDRVGAEIDRLWQVRGAYFSRPPLDVLAGVAALTRRRGHRRSWWAVVVEESPAAAPEGVARSIVSGWAAPAPTSPPPGVEELSADVAGESGPARDVAT